jgi:hypothetical protein
LKKCRIPDQVETKAALTEERVPVSEASHVVEPERDYEER